MITVARQNVSHTRVGFRGLAYPLVVSEDTTFRECNFTQAVPHTDIFAVADGVRVVFEDCNLLNASVPDGAEVIGGNLAHVVRTATGNPDRPHLNLLCDDDRCVSAVHEIRERIAARNLPRDERGRIRHHEMKPAIRARRPVQQRERDAIVAENAAALARWVV